MAQSVERSERRADRPPSRTQQVFLRSVITSLRRNGVQEVAARP